jgi:CubicO group peptidase (beta-lactamase class C family)
MSKNRIATSSLAMLLATHAVAQGCHDLNAVTGVAQELLQQSSILGRSCVSIEQHGTNVYSQCFGSLADTDVLPIASATKTLSAAVLMTLVDDGLLALDDRVGQYLPEWNVGAHAQITLRMCFAHTSGLPANHPAVTDTSLTLRQAAAQLAAVPLDSTPGTAFAYGNVSMHVAGAVCEVVTGQPWVTLFAQRIAQPLGMTSTDFGDPAAVTANPLIAGGARSNRPDFAAFMSMLRARGVHAGVQVLSAASVDEMLQEQTAGTVMVRNVHPAQVPYGIGIWIERQNSSGETLRAAAAGAFGFTGWVDRAHDSSGVFAVRYVWPLVFPYTERIHDAIEEALLPDGVSCVGVGTPACASATWLNGTGPARAGNADFALLVSRAPQSAFGNIVIGDPFPVGIQVADLTAFIFPALDFVATVFSDADGRAIVPAPLPVGLAGQTFALQTVWVSNSPCTALGFEASHALVIDVRP